MAEIYMREAIRLALDAVRSKCGGPFGAVIVRNDQIIGRGSNRVLEKKDPTAHAELEAIRAACVHLGSYDLSGCEIYSSCEPCPMCLGAIYWARIGKVYYGAGRDDAAEIGFDDTRIYQEMAKEHHCRSITMENLMREEALCAFREWVCCEHKIIY